MSWFQASHTEFDNGVPRLDRVQACIDWLAQNVGPEHASRDFSGQGFAFELDVVNKELLQLSSSARVASTDSITSFFFEVFIHDAAQADAFRAVWGPAAA